MPESDNRIKILVDAHIFDHSYQGTATYIKGLYNSLIKFQDIDIVLCAKDIVSHKKHFPDPRFQFIALTTDSKIKRLAIEYPKIIRNGKFHFAHFQYIVPLVRTTKFIDTIHDVVFLDFKEYFPWTYRLTKGFLYWSSAIRSDIVLTVSEYSKKAILNHFKIRTNVHVTPNAVELSPKSEIDIKSKYGLEKYILYVSRFEPRKNQIGLLQTYLELELFKKGYSLVYIGSKKESIEEKSYNDLQEHISAEVKQYIRFYEGIAPDELNAFYQGASCFVYPSLFEGFGIPPLEAAINGCKVLCSNQTAMSDFNFFKYQFNPNRMDEFKEKLDLILKDENYPYREIMDTIENQYQWDVVAARFYEILKTGNS